MCVVYGVCVFVRERVNFDIPCPYDNTKHCENKLYILYIYKNIDTTKESKKTAKTKYKPAARIKYVISVKINESMEVEQKRQPLRSLQIFCLSMTI